MAKVIDMSKCYIEVLYRSSHVFPPKTDLRSGLESGPGALRGGGGECGVFAQTEDWRWIHRNGGWERVSVCRRGRINAEAVAPCWSDWPLLFYRNITCIYSL